jgi:hypothetical protein
MLRGPAYARIAVERYSPWTYRIMSRVWGQYRADARQCFPGEALTGAKGLASRLVVWRFRGAAPSAEAAILAGLRSLYDGRAETAQTRLFQASQPDGKDFIVIVERRMAANGEGGSVSVFGDAACYVDLVNVYVPYTRRIAGAFPQAC